MLASVLRSPSAIQMSVMVTRAFVAMRRAIFHHVVCERQS